MFLKNVLNVLNQIIFNITVRKAEKLKLKLKKYKKKCLSFNLL